MKHDDDTSGFLGVTYISHGKDHKNITDTDRPKDAKTSKNPEEHHKLASVEKTQKENEAEIERLQHEIVTLEKALLQYESQTSERLDHLERLAGHPVTDAERIFKIQEEA